MTDLVEGAPAPPFNMAASAGRRVSNADYAGTPFLLYFYPKANTPGCTQQACAFQEALPALAATGLAIIGVSPDAMKPIENFAAKYSLTFPLASDSDQATAAAYGTWVEKSMYGRKYMGMERSSFLIAGDGRIARIWRKIKIPGHASEVLAAARAL